ncbi:hypothetical protein ORD22_14115 [Sporosarcina sp. GW1-11]|nr:hypothetical protein [Sporosarcina sp. GW1-11]
MNAVMGFASAADHLQRVDAVRRRNAETSYERQTEFLNQTKRTKADLEALLRGDVPETQTVQPKTDFNKLDAGQMRNIVVPLGNNLEETIDLWRDVRREAYSEVEPTTADYQLGSKASAKITEAEFLLALHNRAKTIREHMSSGIGFTPANSSTERAMYRVQLHYNNAFSAYDIQSQARNNRYKTEWPQMNVSI